MTSHFSIRLYLRQQVKAFLVSGEIVSGIVPLDATRIFSNRLRPLHADRLPVIGIRTLGEKAERLNVAPVSFARTATLEVVCAAAVDAGIDDTLDAMAAQVEDILLTAVAANLFLLEGEPYLNRFEIAYTDFTLDMGASEIGAVAIGFEIGYDTTHEPALDDLDCIGLTVKAAGAGGPIFTDTVNIES